MRPTNVKGDQGMSEDQMGQMGEAARQDEATHMDDVAAHQMGENDQMGRQDEATHNDEATDNDDVTAHQMGRVDAMDQIERHDP
jgi:hypothetical protein